MTSSSLMVSRNRAWQFVAAGSITMLVACGGGGDDGGGGGDGGGSGGNPTPISIPAGMNVARVTVTATATAIAPAVPPGDYEFAASGIGPQRNLDELYANFREGATGSTLRLMNFYGLNRVGTFACGERAKPDDDYAVPTSIDFRDIVGGGGFYDSHNAGSTCEVSVTFIEATMIEGRFSATLKTSDASGTVSMTGEFRAHAP